MDNNQLLKEWKRNSIRIGSPTNLLAAITSFIPVIWLCTKYNCWPDPKLIFSAWGMVALSFGAFYIVEPVSYYAFEVLYWTGIREGELLALERGDFNIPDRRLTINKSYQHLQGEDYITSPKTEKSNRVIELPEFLCREMEDYFGMIYKCDEHTRLFTFSKSYLHHEMDRGAKAAGVKRIRIHDLRHSHVSLSKGYFWDSLSDCLR